MMPDGGECCAGHAAVCEDWHKQRAHIEALQDRLQLIRMLLGGWDAQSLPDDYTTEKMAADRMADLATHTDRIEALEAAYKRLMEKT